MIYVHTACVQRKSPKLWPRSDSLFSIYSSSRQISICCHAAPTSAPPGLCISSAHFVVVYSLSKSLCTCHLCLNKSVLEVDLHKPNDALHWTQKLPSSWANRYLGFSCLPLLTWEKSTKPPTCPFCRKGDRDMNWCKARAHFFPHHSGLWWLLLPLCRFLSSLNIYAFFSL